MYMIKLDVASGMTGIPVPSHRKEASGGTPVTATQIAGKVWFQGSVRGEIFKNEKPRQGKIISLGDLLASIAGQSAAAPPPIKTGRHGGSS